MTIDIMNQSVVVGDADAVDRMRVDAVHRLSMSTDPDQAAHGRFLKDVMPAFINWFDAEIRRGNHDLSATTQGLCYGVSNAILSWAGTMGALGKEFEFARAMLGMLSDCIDAADDNDLGVTVARAKAEHDRP